MCYISTVNKICKQFVIQFLIIFIYQNTKRISTGSARVK